MLWPSVVLLSCGDEWNWLLSLYQCYYIQYFIQKSNHIHSKVVWVDRETEPWPRSLRFDPHNSSSGGFIDNHLREVNVDMWKLMLMSNCNGHCEKSTLAHRHAHMTNLTNDHWIGQVRGISWQLKCLVQGTPAVHANIGDVHLIYFSDFTRRLNFDLLIAKLPFEVSNSNCWVVLFTSGGAF